MRVGTMGDNQASPKIVLSPSGGIVDVLAQSENTRVQNTIGATEEISAKLARKGGAFSHSKGQSPVQSHDRPLFWKVVIWKRPECSLF